MSHFARKAQPVHGWKRKGPGEKELVVNLAQDGNRLVAESHKRLWEGRYRAQ